ncbi:TPA: hypothetical protein N0F65_004235 [Lagenidium giganteum]|uniref:RCC1-like domain-containing protein n=1 Tax=Lagenidium giganteum TaxID=4803 RepID=A0AAV2ZFI0_9STRA|nr:TPA: hypothetical protein N0F65_004235 [Lagenidium giganteum]
MGLRSRQRRLAGVSREDSYDPEASKHRMQSLEEHLQASKNGVAEFNLLWKERVALAGLGAALYELALLYQMMTAPKYSANNLPLCLGLKLIALASIFSTRQYIQSGSNAPWRASIYFSLTFVLIWACCQTQLEQPLSLVQVSPMSLLYLAVALAALHLMGGNTKAERARAEQLEKLEQLFHTCKSVTARNGRRSSYNAIGSKMTMDDGVRERVWKVSKALDQLALMCEQHHLQMQSRPGLPDWRVPDVAAGVSSRKGAAAPLNFAWQKPKQNQAAMDLAAAETRPASPIEAATSASNDHQSHAPSMTESAEKRQQELRRQAQQHISRVEETAIVAPAPLRTDIIDDVSKLVTKSTHSPPLDPQPPVATETEAAAPREAMPSTTTTVPSAHHSDVKEISRRRSRDTYSTVAAGCAPAYMRRPVVTSTAALRVAAEAKSEFLTDSEEDARADADATVSLSIQKEEPVVVTTKPSVGFRLADKKEEKRNQRQERSTTPLGKGVTIHVCVIMNKCGIVVEPPQILVTASDWKTPREIRVTGEPDSEIRTIQIHHKINEPHDEVYNTTTIIPSVFVSVLQKEATFLFSFGCGLHGRLGTNDEENATTPTPFTCKWLHPVQIACGKAHSAIIDVYSNIYCFGNGALGQLGQGDANMDHSKLPLRVPAVGTGAVLHVACGSNHTFCMTTEGKVFGWGDNSFGQLGLGAKTVKPRAMPTRVEKVVNVRAIVCGGNHSFILTTDNNVLACGSNIAGQLGLGDTKDRASFERVPFFRKHASMMSTVATGHSLVSDLELATGLYHTLALCCKRVYSWGNGDNGRLGHGNIESYLEPEPIAAFRDVAVKFIACGGAHSGAITFADDVYMWGNGQQGQLGNGLYRDRRVPTRVRLLKGKQVVQLSCGEWHSTGLCEDGTLYSWGFGEEGQLGLPVDDKHTRSVSLPTIIHSLSGTGATMVRCGGSHTFVVSVLEARRPNLALLHRKASRTEVLRENGRLLILARHFSKKFTMGSENAVSVGAVSMGTVAEQSEGDNEVDKQNEAQAPTTTEHAPKKPQPRKPKRQSPRVSELKSPLPLSTSYSWKERPMTTRAAVRNALRQEAKALNDYKEQLAPCPLSARLEKTKTVASVHMSPRMKRFHDQMMRSTEAGASMIKASNMLSGRAVQEVEDVVHVAAEEYLRNEQAAFVMDERDMSLGVHTTTKGQTEDAQEATTLEGVSVTDDVSIHIDDLEAYQQDAISDDDEEEMTISAGIQSRCLSLEADIIRRLGQ